MNAEEIAARLEELGLEADTALVYVRLHALGPSRAGDLASACGLSRPRTYRALEVLAQQGFVLSGLSRPRIFEASPPSVLFEHLRHRADRMQQEIRGAETEMEEALRALEPKPKDTRAESHFDIIRERRSVLAEFHRLAERARHDLAVMFVHPGGLPFLATTGTLALLRRRAQEGVRVRVLTKPRPENAEILARELGGSPVEVRTIDTDHIMALHIFDESTVLSILVPDPSTRMRSERPVAFRTDALDYARTQAFLFEKAWDAAKNGTVRRG